MKQTKKEKWLKIRVDEKTDQRLDSVKDKKGITKQHFVNQAIIEKLKNEKL